MITSNNIADKALELIENTKHHIFLTGKAGTGKTTFLHRFKEKTKKNYVVLAPTGIAAINAGGMTIHSFFRLPLRTFVPADISPNHDLVIGRRDLFKHLNYREDKKKLIRSLDVIIIDEASMLRADILDMIDISLRTTRKSQKVFGGVQMLFIGDLFQLPPVLRQHELGYFKQYYKTAFFYSAEALEHTPLFTIELLKVYRQKDNSFIHILEEIRSGTPSPEALEHLNTRYRPNDKLLSKGSIYLCTHNAQAEKINQKELEALEGNLVEYHCIVEGDFSEKIYPTDEIIRLKPGAQVMFIRNDVGQFPRYFNGKIGTVKSCNEDDVTVELDNGEEISVSQEEWTNKKYGLDSDNRVLESSVGSFMQLPLRLAWAVTIHKSQGLTFDKMTIDAQHGFASGQVYVALSRCRTLEGISLSSKIYPRAIFVDPEIVQFHHDSVANDAIPQLIEAGKNPFAAEYISQKLNPMVLKASFQKVLPQVEAHFFGEMEEYVKVFRLAYKYMVDIETWWNQLSCLLTRWGDLSTDLQENLVKIQEKSKAAILHFDTYLRELMYPAIDAVYSKIKSTKPNKELKLAYEILIQDFTFYHAEISSIYLFGEKLSPEITPIKKDATFQGVKVRNEKIPSYYRTLQYVKDNCSPEDIAEKLNYTVSTVYTHLEKLIQENKIEESYVQKLIPKEKIKEFRDCLKDEKYTTLTEIREKTGEHFNFNEIRLLSNFFGNKINP